MVTAVGTTRCDAGSMHTGSEQSVTGGDFKKFLEHYQLSKHFEKNAKGWGWGPLNGRSIWNGLEARLPRRARHL